MNETLMNRTVVTLYECRPLGIKSFMTETIPNCLQKVTLLRGLLNNLKGI